MRTQSCGASEEVVTGTHVEFSGSLTDEQWDLIRDLFEELCSEPLNGRPPAPARNCFEGIAWVLRTGARWKDIPKCFPSGPTCWRRPKRWTESGVWDRAWGRLLRKLEQKGRINLDTHLADATFSPAKKGEIWSVRPNVEREPRLSCSPTETDCRWGAISATALEPR